MASAVITKGRPQRREVFLTLVGSLSSFKSFGFQTSGGRASSHRRTLNA
jgi:hypothetical protein